MTRLKCQYCGEFKSGVLGSIILQKRIGITRQKTLGYWCSLICFIKGYKKIERKYFEDSIDDKQVILDKYQNLQITKDLKKSCEENLKDLKEATKHGGRRNKKIKSCGNTLDLPEK